MEEPLGAKFNLRCGCGQTTALPVAWIRAQKTFVCPRCGAATSLVADDLRAKLAAAERNWQLFWTDWDELPEPVLGTSLPPSAAYEPSTFARARRLAEPPRRVS